MVYADVETCHIHNIPLKHRKDKNGKFCRICVQGNKKDKNKK